MKSGRWNSKLWLEFNNYKLSQASFYRFKVFISVRIRQHMRRYLQICARLIDDIGQLLSPSGSNSLSAPSYRPAGPYTWALTKAPRGARKTAPWQGPLWRWRCESAPSIQGRSEKKANASFRWLETPPVSTATRAYNSPAVCVFCWLMMVYLVFYLIYSSTRSNGLRRLWPWPFSTSCEGDNWN